MAQRSPRQQIKPDLGKQDETADQQYERLAEEVATTSSEGKWSEYSSVETPEGCGPASEQKRGEPQEADE